MIRLKIILFLMLFCGVGRAQTKYQDNIRLPQMALKTNALYWATSTPNASFEIATRKNKKLTWNFLVGYNPFTFKDNKKLKHWLVQPEMRWWTCERFNGHFFGIHAHGGEFNMGGVKLPFGAFPSLRDYRYQGEFYGGGLSYGYQWVLGKRWNLEAEIGAGYTRVHYNKYDCPRCGEWRDKGRKNFVSVTKAAVSLVYVIK